MHLTLLFSSSYLQINGIVAWGDFVYTCGIDDSLRQISVESNSYTDYVVKLNCQPRGLAIFRNENIIALACVKELTLVQDNKKVFSLPIKYEASSISANPETLDVAVTGDDHKVHVYTLKGTTLEEKIELQHLGPVTDCSYSPDNKYLVACDANRKVILYAVEEYNVSKLVDGYLCNLCLFSCSIFSLRTTRNGASTMRVSIPWLGHQIRF